MRIGLLGSMFQPYNPKGLVTGFLMASYDLTESFLHYSQAEEIVCLYEPGQFREDQLPKFLDSFSKDDRVRLVSEYDVLFHGTSVVGNVDILHSVKEDALPLLELREAMAKPIPITFTVHSLAEQHLMLDTLLPLVLLPFKPYDAILCTSEAVRDTLSRILARCQKVLHLSPSTVNQPAIRLEKVPLGVDMEKFRPRDPIAARNFFHISQDAFVILWFGRFSDLYKADLYPLLHVFQQLLKKNPQKKLMLVLAGNEDGSSHYKNFLHRQAETLGIQSHVQWINSHEILDRSMLYSACDVFTSPVDNVQETFGLTPIEAMACGIPQVVSDWDGYRDTVVHGVTGYRIPTVWGNCLQDIAQAEYLPLNPQRRRLLQRYLAVRSVVVDCTEYEEKLQFLIDHPQRCAEMGKASRAYAESHFSLRNTVAQTEAVWQKLLQIAADTHSEFSQSLIPALDYCHDFETYPSEKITDETFFKITDHGLHTPVRELPQYGIFERYIEESALPAQILAYLTAGPGQIAEFSRAFQQYSLSQIRREFLFLYKYDMIKACLRSKSCTIETQM